LIESELFGYVDGAFTGTKRGGKPGKFELADKGTLLLDKIGEIPNHMQVKLLRVLQEKTGIRIGGSRERSFDVKIIASTNRDLYKKVLESLFRDDLYYRINVISATVPPLRDRIEDLPLLIEYFLNRSNIIYN
jgi:transcriptional regulator with PAS, ATPase and Fis domain